MSFERLMWIFAAGFILCGMALFFVTQTGPRHVWGGLATLSLGCFGLAMALNGVAKGELKLQYSTIRRAGTPYGFWAAVFIIAAVGAGVTGTAFWAMFFKVR